MKVTVNKYLNVRVGEPSVNAPCYQYLAPGSELEVDGQLYKGNEYKGIDTWLKDAANNYYWSGGTNYTSSSALLQNVNPLISTLFNYNAQIGLNHKFRTTKGLNTTVAIVDSGCYAHSAIKGSIVNSYNVFSKTSIQSDDSGHGTFLAGIIAASEKSENKIIGIAPRCQLIIVKAIQNSQVLAKPILDALQWIDNLVPPPDIVNMSFDFNPGALGGQLSAVINSLIAKKVILVAAAQDGAAVYSGPIYYPANDPSVVGVASISKQDIQLFGLNTQVNYLVPNKEFLSLRNFPGDYKTLSGSSVGSALVSGAFALIVSQMKLNGITFSGLSTTKSILDKEAKLLTSDNFDNSLKLYKS